MLLKFKVRNYRSYREEATFSMESEVSKLKAGNVFDYQLGNGQSIKYLKTAAIYGANASGKTNLIRALYNVVSFIVAKPQVDEKVVWYDPFLFEEIYQKEPSYFEIHFIGPQRHRYVYNFSVNSQEVVQEELYYFPNGRSTELFTRSNASLEGRTHTGVLGDSLDKKRIPIFANQLLLSKFGLDEPDAILSEVFLYFKEFYVMNAINNQHHGELRWKVTEELFVNASLKSRVARLLRAADTQIDGVSVSRLTTEEIDRLPPALQSLARQNPYIVEANHRFVDEAGNVIRTVGLPMDQESRGSQTLYALGGKVLSTLDTGGVLVVDELDTSLHPYVTRLLIALFQSQHINLKGAQLIFTTHDVSLLDRDFLRKDQIWFTEKTVNGSTDLYSLQDFDGLREDSPFEKWYLAGKFGGLPNIGSVDKIFDDASRF